MEIEVTKCEGCPLWSMDIDGSEYCSRGGKPEDRYKVWDIDALAGIVKDIPDDCPLIQSPVTVVLIKE